LPTSPTQIFIEPSISTIAFEHRIAAIESTISRISKETKTICVVIDDKNSKETATRGKRLLDDSEELVELAADIVQRSTSMAGSVASTVVNEPSHRVWESASIDGVPLGPRRREKISNWAKNFQSDKKSSNPGKGHGKTTKILRNTQPESEPGRSRVEHGDVLDIDVELAQQRYQVARTFFLKRKYAKAIPLLRKSLTRLSESQNQTVRYNLAFALLLVEPDSDEPLAILEELSKCCLSGSYIHSVAHLLAEAQLRSDPSKAKESCHLAIEKRFQKLGKEHHWTRESIALMVEICEVSGDPDADVWREMLRSSGSEYDRKSQESGKAKPRAAPSSYRKRGVRGPSSSQ
jgi:hypothetical protein